MNRVEYVGPVPPTDAERDDRWWNPKDGRLYVYDGQRWVPVLP